MEGKNISGWRRITLARKLLTDEFLLVILDNNLDEKRPLLTIKFKKGFTLNIRYNDYDEYSYQVQFSQKQNDFIRYDNFDGRWDVTTKPHHFHQRLKKEVIESPMKGKPEKDIPI